MNHIDMTEHVSDLLGNEIFKRIESRFDNIYVHNRTTTSRVPNSIYINNGIEDGTSSDHGGSITVELEGVDTRHMSSPQLDIVMANHDYRFNCGGRCVGGYMSLDNILILSDITHVFNSYTTSLLKAVFDWLDENTRVSEQTIEKLIKPRDQAFLTMGNSVYVLRVVSESVSGREAYVNEVTKKASALISKLRKQWVESLNAEKARYDRLRSSTVQMPDLSKQTVIDNRLMLSRAGTTVMYSFIVDFTVKDAIAEIASKHINLDEPIEYKNVVLTFYLNEKNRLDNVTMSYPNGSRVPHLHSNQELGVCVGSTEMIGEKYTNPTDIIELKNRLVKALCTFNIDSCYSSANPEIYSLLKAKIEAAEAGSIDDEMWSSA